MMIVLALLNCVSPALLFDKETRKRIRCEEGRKGRVDKVCFLCPFGITEISGFQLSKDKCYLIRNTECRSYILEEEHLV